jgi:hypothetical protein
MGRRRPFIKEMSASELKAALGLASEEQRILPPGLLELPPEAAAKIIVERAVESYLDEATTINHLISGGIDDAINLLVELYGVKEVKERVAALRLPAGRPRVFEHSSEGPVIWLAVEVRRAACRGTIAKDGVVDACKHLARHPRFRDLEGQPLSYSAQEIKTAFNKAVERLEEMPRAKKRLELIGAAVLLKWRQSGKLYDTFESEFFADPQWAIEEK